jgi:hypothetical protein
MGAIRLKKLKKNVSPFLESTRKNPDALFSFIAGSMVCCGVRG